MQTVNVYRRGPEKTCKRLLLECGPCNSSPPPLSIRVADSLHVQLSRGMPGPGRRTGRTPRARPRQGAAPRFGGGALRGCRARHPCGTAPAAPITPPGRPPPEVRPAGRRRRARRGPASAVDRLVEPGPEVVDEPCRVRDGPPDPGEQDSDEPVARVGVGRGTGSA